MEVMKRVARRILSRSAMGPDMEQVCLDRTVCRAPFNRMAMHARAALLRCRAAAATAAVAGLALNAQATVVFQVGFNDPGSVYSSYYDRIRRNVVAAGSEWASYFTSGYNASLQVQLSFADIATASSGSVTNWYVGQSNGYSTYEQGAAYEVLTGKDPNGATPDIRIIIGSSGYLQNELWFDPSPTRQTATVPVNRTDARSVFLHELGHAFAFSGWRDPFTGALPGGYQSTFDAWVAPSIANGQTQLYFAGGSASSLYGGPVPLTMGSYGHLGNAAPRPGSTLVSDLMNGVSFYRGTRYHVTSLDLAILSDTSFPTSWQYAGLGSSSVSSLDATVPMAMSIPEPSTWVLMLGGLAMTAWSRRRAFLAR